MKKFLKLLPLCVIALAMVFLSGCNQNINAPGKVWAQNETLEYAVTDGETVVGTMTVVTQRVSGEQALTERPEHKHNLVDGSRITTTVRDAEGNIIQYSESLMQGFAAVASYRYTNAGGQESRYHVYIDGSHAYIAIDSDNYQRVRMRGTYTTNELLYWLLRCYDLSSYSASYTVLSPVSGDKIGLTVSTFSTTDVFDFTAVNPDSETPKEGVAAYGVRVSLSDSPVGSNIRLWYSKDFSLQGSAAGGNTPSSNVLLKIEENNLIYTLTKITVA